MRSLIEVVIGMVLAVLLIYGMKSDDKAFRLAASFTIGAVCVLATTTIGRMVRDD